MSLPVLRRSAMQTAKSCLFRYNEVWNKGVIDMSPYALRGIGFHACAHAYIKRLVAAQTPADEEEARLAFMEGIASSQTPADLVPEVKIIFDGWARNFALDLQHFLAAEEKQSAKDEHTFTPDLVYGRPNELEILDFKTYWVEMTEAQVKQDFQARYYLYTGMRVWPNFPVYRFTLSFVRFGTFTSVTFTKDELDGFADEVQAVVDSVEESERLGSWPATPGPECGFCDLRCPIMDQPQTYPARLVTKDDAQRAAGLVLVGDAMLKTVKKALKAYASANGPLDVQGVRFDNWPVEQRSYPAEAVIDALRALQSTGALEQESGLTLSHSALAKLFKRFPVLVERLKGVVQSKRTYRFGSKKLGALGPGAEDED